MFKRVDLKIVITLIVIFIIALSQFIPIARVLAATVETNNEFFTQRSDYCANSAGDCDGLLQYGLYACVYQAANAGYFYSSTGKTGYNNATNNYDNASDNYEPAFATYPYTLVTDLLAYYYGVDVAAWVAASGSNACSVPVNTSLPASEIDSLDNIGASFDILEFVNGSTVPDSDFSYSPSSPAFVTLNNTISPFINDVVADENDSLICTPSDLSNVQEPSNTGLDISQANFDVGKTPVSGARSMFGILDPTKSTTCTTNTNDYVYLIDQRCGNISDKPLVPVLPHCPPGDTGVYPNCVLPNPGTAVCSISDSTGGYAPQVGTPVSFYLSWSLPDPQTTSFYSTVTSNLNGTNVSPEQSGYTATSAWSLQSAPLVGTPVSSASAQTITYSGSLIALVSGIDQTVYCSDSVTWTSPSNPNSSCTTALNALEGDYISVYGTMSTVQSDNANLDDAYVATNKESAIRNDENSLGNQINLLSNELITTRSDLTSVTLNCSCQAPAAQAAINYYQSYIFSEMPVVSSDFSILNGAYVGTNNQSTIRNYENSLGNQVGVLYGEVINSFEPDITTTVYYTCTAPPCPPGYLGTPPNCYLPYTPPPTCPPGETGTYPNCMVPIIPPPVLPSGPESYFSVSGGDTVVGTGFGPACVDDLNAGIVASNIGNNPWTGASDNLAVLAPDIINGFSTGNASYGTLGDPLTFDNTDNSPYGGSFGTTNQLCSQDFYSTSSNVAGFGSLTPAAGSFSLPGVATSSACTTLNSVIYCSLRNPVQISGNPPSGARVVLYVSGNAEISGNIFIYSNDPSPLTSPSNIPLLYVISNGNIYIDSQVQSIDGVYVADNLNDADKTDNGIIFTCANSGSSFASGSALITACGSQSNQLTVNGALVAGQIKFGRTYGGINSSNIAPSETINYGPEVWLSQVNTASGLPINPDYQSITELSPVI